MKRATTKDLRQRNQGEFERTRKQLGLNQKDFPVWLPDVTPAWTWDWAHQLIIYGALQRVTDGTCKRLMIFMPPRHSKSETVTVRYAAYRLERTPMMNLIIGAYNQDLANRFSRKIRRIVKPRVKLSRDKTEVKEWETLAGGGVRAAGVGAGVTGFGANLVLIDDPVKNRKEAESKTYRDAVMEWFNDDLYTRLEPDAAIILTMTRWHDDDLAGRLRKEMENEGEQWEIIELPAIAEENDLMGRAPGEALCPSRYNLDALGRIRKKLGEYSFAALYQQRPTPRDGALFKRAWFEDKIIDNAPPGLRWVRGYDLAVETKTANDESASFRVAFDKAGNLYIADGWAGKVEAPVQKRYMLERMRLERDTEHAISKTLHGSAFIQEFRRLPQVRAAAFRGVNERGDKFTRALAWATRFEEGRGFLVRGAWTDEFINECCAFTGTGKDRDNRVDAVSIAVQRAERKGGRGAGF